MSGGDSRNPRSLRLGRGDPPATFGLVGAAFKPAKFKDDGLWRFNVVTLLHSAIPHVWETFA
jgi:hypothetical protein